MSEAEKKNNKFNQPMKYRCELGNSKWFELQLPCPFEKLTKRERQKIVKWAKEYVDSMALKSKIEAKSHYEALLLEAQKIKEDYGF